MSNFIKKNPINYLEHLEYKNRAKKIKENEFLKRNGHIIQREENFHLFFNGANDLRIKNSRKAQEQSKSPSNRKKWQNNQQKSFYRKPWDNPATPLLLKEQVEGIPENYNKDVYNRESQSKDFYAKNNKEEIEKDVAFNTRNTFKVAGNALVRPDSKKDYFGIAQRIEKLNSDKQEHILRILEQLEIENSNFEIE